jgi:hypothetical protein
VRNIRLRFDEIVINAIFLYCQSKKTIEILNVRHNKEADLSEMWDGTSDRMGIALVSLRICVQCQEWHLFRKRN